MGFEVTVTPQTWSSRGEAEYRSRGRNPLTIFQGIVGERAKISVVHRGKNRDFGLWVGSEKPHAHRVEPPCDRYRVCGGCPMMHLTEDGQEVAHRQMVQDALGELPVSIGRWSPSPEGLSDFRRVVKLGFGRSDRGRIRVGAWGRRDRRIVPIPECVVADPVLNRVMAALAHHVIDMDIWPYEPETDRGVLKAAVLRSSRTTGEVLVTLVAGRRFRALGDLAEAVAQQVSEVVGVWVHLNSDPGNAIFSRGEDGRVGVRPLAGRETIAERMNGIEYRIGPGDFFQTHPAMAEQIYGRVLERLDLSRGDAVVDLYCGVGGLALQAAAKTGWALGVEEVEGAVARAREAARINKVDAEFVSGRVEEVLVDVKKRLRDTRPVVTVNPARRGLEEGVVGQIVALDPTAIAYVSCNPTALARDLALFLDAGFVAEDVELFEMFPNTAHVECLVILRSPNPTRGRTRAPRRKVVRP